MKKRYFACLSISATILAHAEAAPPLPSPTPVAAPEQKTVNVMPTQVQPTYLQTSNESLETNNTHLDAIDQRIAYENSLANNPFMILPYMPTYILPAYYSQYPYYSVYNGHTPDNQQLNHTELKFQFSFMVPIWKNILNRPSSLFFAYTQDSFWQAYNSSPFFRETDYQPELFVANYFNKSLPMAWHLKFVNFGAVHESNGQGGELERSWNRIYGETILSKNNWAVYIKPWYVIKDSSMENHNSDITHYLGYGNVQVAYKYHQQTFGISFENELESRFGRGAENLSWSFPLTTHLKGYVEVFSGYGQSLIEYNHFTNSAGIGIALNDWI